MLHHNCALEHGADAYRLAGDDGIEPRSHFVVERRNNAGERNQFCGSTHSNPPKAGAATKKRRPQPGSPILKVGGKRCYQKPDNEKRRCKTGAVVSMWG